MNAVFPPGLIYRFGDIDDFYEKLKHVVENEGLRRSISLRGCESISGLWNESVGRTIDNIVEGINGRKK